MHWKNASGFEFQHNQRPHVEVLSIYLATKDIDQQNIVGAILLDFCAAYDVIDRSLLLSSADVALFWKPPNRDNNKNNNTFNYYILDTGLTTINIHELNMNIDERKCI